MSDYKCGVCLEDFYYQPEQLRLTRECKHQFCKQCITQQFEHTVGTSIACPICRRRIENFENKTFDEIEVDSQYKIRKEVYDIMNKYEEDFSDIKEYDDFSEKREDLIVNLSSTNNMIKNAAKKYLETYKIENQLQIHEFERVHVERQSTKIKEIVEKEGVFYEIVKMSFKYANRDSLKHVNIYIYIYIYF
eukprot:GHVL01033898.1.p1 GENE.GHVL01033898.1~~GHVL01033898.1.p1  ORF type:complete len:191 (+),score=44.59 GHVL01033898.1:46-618(+)